MVSHNNDVKRYYDLAHLIELLIYNYDLEAFDIFYSVSHNFYFYLIAFYLMDFNVIIIIITNELFVYLFICRNVASVYIHIFV